MKENGTSEGAGRRGPYVCQHGLSELRAQGHEGKNSTNQVVTVQMYLGQVSPSFPSTLSRKIFKYSPEVYLALPAGMAWRGGVYDPVDLRSRSKSSRIQGRHAGQTEIEFDGQLFVSKRKEGEVIITIPEVPLNRYLLAGTW